MGAIDLDRSTWPEVKAELAAGRDAAVIAFGAIEQHGPHLPLATDALAGDHHARLVADRLDAYGAATVRIGCSEHHLEFPGTLSVSESTFHELLADIVRSLARGESEVPSLLSSCRGARTRRRPVRGGSACVSEFDRGLGENQTLCPMRHVGSCGVWIARRRPSEPSTDSLSASGGFCGRVLARPSTVLAAEDPVDVRAASVSGCPANRARRGYRSSRCVEAGVRPSTGRARSSRGASVSRSRRWRVHPWQREGVPARPAKPCGSENRTPTPRPAPRRGSGQHYRSTETERPVQPEEPAAAVRCTSGCFPRP